MGGALLRRGRAREALPWFRSGHELGSKRPDWRYPSQAWIEMAERQIEREGRLEAILAGTRRPSALERTELAPLLCLKGRYAEAARMYADAFAEEPALSEDLTAGHRYNASCMASLAAGAEGADTADWRGRALEWLKADLAATLPLAGAATRLGHWKRDPDLAAVRDRLDRLPQAEAEAWRALWRDVDAALAAAAPR
jgi:hypothetical protein